MIWLMLACSNETPPPADVPDPTAAIEQARAEAQGRASGAIEALTGALKGTLMDAMSQKGPAGAMSACADQAQGTAALALSGVRARAGRTSTKLRSPANRAPDWVVPWLEKYGSGTLAEASFHVHIIEADGTVTAQIIQPIEVKALCLTCHGDAATIPSDVAAILAERYPNDAATGYAESDLRGAVWAEATVTVGQ